MMHVVICEDECCFQEAVQNAVEAWKAASGHADVACTCFRSSEEFLKCWEKGLPADLIFLDIQFPGELNGMATAKRIYERDQMTSIVFITNYADYVYEGYAVQALRYLKKPVRRAELDTCMELAYQRYTMLNGKKISVISHNQRQVIPLQSVVYIEMASHYLQMSLANSREWLEVRVRLCDFSGRLPEQLFVQCHRSYIVNIDHIRRFARRRLTMSNDAEIPVSQTFAPILKEKFDAYYGGRSL